LLVVTIVKNRDSILARSFELDRVDLPPVIDVYVRSREPVVARVADRLWDEISARRLVHSGAEIEFVLFSPFPGRHATVAAGLVLQNVGQWLRYRQHW
jgi:hypothetical protein